MALFKLPAHYVFDYKPIYYDPRKEDREKRLKRIKKELGIEIENEERLKPSFDFKRPGIYRKRKERTSTIRLVIILSFLMLLVYVFLFTNYFDIFIGKFIR